MNQSGLGTTAKTRSQEPRTPFARSHGYSATRVAGEISTLGLESDAHGMANPSMIKRPILDTGKGTIVGFKATTYENALHGVKA